MYYPRRMEGIAQWGASYFFTHPQILLCRQIRWVGHVACMGEERKEYKVLVGKPEGKRPFG
jgi:hypothetical protein